LSKIHVIKMHG